MHFPTSDTTLLWMILLQHICEAAGNRYRETEHSQTLRGINELQNKSVDFNFMFSLILI